MQADKDFQAKSFFYRLNTEHMQIACSVERGLQYRNSMLYLSWRENGAQIWELLQEVVSKSGLISVDIARC